MAAQDVQFPARLPHPTGARFDPRLRSPPSCHREKIARSIPGSSWPRKTCSSLPGCRIPQARGLVPACGHHRLAIGRKLRARYPTLMAAQDLQFPARLPHPTGARSCPRLRSPPSCHREKIARSIPDPHGRARPAVPSRLPHPTGARSCPRLRSPPSCHREKIARSIPYPHGRAVRFYRYN